MCTPKCHSRIVPAESEPDGAVLQRRLSYHCRIILWSSMLLYAGPMALRQTEQRLVMTLRSTALMVIANLPGMVVSLVPLFLCRLARRGSSRATRCPTAHPDPGLHLSHPRLPVLSHHRRTGSCLGRRGDTWQARAHPDL